MCRLKYNGNVVALRGCLKSPDSRQILSSICSLQLPEFRAFGVFRVSGKRPSHRLNLAIQPAD